MPRRCALPADWPPPPPTLQALPSLQVECAPERADGSQPPEGVHVYLALDISGSMGGAPIEAAKQAVAEFALQALALPALADLQLFLYDDKVQRLELTSCDEAVLRAQVFGCLGGEVGDLPRGRPSCCAFTLANSNALASPLPPRLVKRAHRV